MRLPSTLASVLLAAVTVAASQQAQIPPPTVVPPTPPTTSTVAPRPVAGKPPGIPVRAETAVITGQVVDAGGRGVPKAAVRLVADAVIETVLTDDRGRFFFKTIPPGEAIVTAQKFGYVDGAYGKRRPGGQPLQISLASGQALTDMKVELFKGAVVTGTVSDEQSEPIIGVRVVALRRQFVNGSWHYLEAGSDTADDEGRYRIFNLTPGEYIITTLTSVQSAAADAEGRVSLSRKTQTAVVNIEVAVDATVTTRPRSTRPPELHGIWGQTAVPPRDDGREGVYTTQYFPNTEHRALAAPIQIGSSEVRYAVDFRLTLIPAFQVTGRVLARVGPIGGLTVKLFPQGLDEVSDAEAATTVSQADGTFTFIRVPRGQYRLEAGGPAGAGEALAVDTVILEAPGSPDRQPRGGMWARRDVIVDDEDVDLLDVSLQELTSAHAVVQFEGASRDAENGDVVVELRPATPGVARTTRIRRGADGRYETNQMVPGSYFVSIASIPRGWYLRAINAGGRDALDSPIDVDEGGVTIMVRLTSRRTEITGSVRDSRLAIAPGATVIIMPVTATGAAVWTPNRTRETRASAGGVFTVHGLPPGEYMVVAIDDAVAEGWQDPAVIAMLRTMAVRVSLREAETRNLSLRLSPLKR